MKRTRHWGQLNSVRAILVAGVALLGGAAMAQDYPNRPITALYPAAGGGTVEQGLRIISTEAGKILGQPILVEARPGGNGMIAANAVKQARGNPYLLGLLNNGVTVTVPLVSTSKLEVVTDYVPVSVLLSTNLVVIVYGPSSGVTSRVRWPISRWSTLRARASGSSGCRALSVSLWLT